MESYIILIAGLPGAGKTTFAEYLSQKLGIPSYNKDHVKEIIVDTLGFKDRAENRLQSGLAFYLLRYMAARGMERRICFILESNFRKNEGESLKELIAEHGYIPITVFFDVKNSDMGILYDRFIRRIESGERHPAHTSAVPANVREYLNAVLPLRDFDVGGRRINADAGIFSKYTHDNIYAMIEGIVNGKSLIYQRPEPSMKTEITAFIEDFAKNGETTVNGCCRLTGFEKFEDWLDFQERVSEREVDGRLPSTVYLVRRVGDFKIVGIVDIRHYVKDRNYQMGHVGLSVAPGERSKGYGNDITAWGIEKARAFGNSKVVISCGVDNEHSRGMIEKNGLKFEGLFTDDDGSILRTYSIGDESYGRR